LVNGGGRKPLVLVRAAIFGCLMQLSFYLTALDKYVKKPGENKSIGVLLCEDMNRTVVKLAVQDYNKPLGVATYRLDTEIPEP